MSAQSSTSPLGVLRPQPWDSWAVLLLWICRRAFLPLLALGIIPVALAGQLDSSLAGELDTPQDLLAAVFSPLWLLAVAGLLRIATAAAEFALAFHSPSADGGYPSDAAQLTKWQRFSDQFTLASGRAALRRTWFVRYEAIHRLGSAGDVLKTLGLIVLWSLLPAVLLAIVVLMVIYS
jgi:hypothetical protein